jgi:hypothetical protein
MLKAKLLGATAAAESLAIEDVFSTYLYTGNDSTQTITNDIDLAGEGGLVWLKNRTTTGGNTVFDTERGASGGYISTNTTSAQSGSASSFAFNSDGFTAGTINNSSPYNYASWTFRKAERFFDVVTYTGTGSARTIPHGLGVVPGCIIVKCTSSGTVSFAWNVYHRSLTSPAASWLLLNSTNAATSDTGSRWNNTLPTDSVFSVKGDDSTNANGQTYVAYLFAHDPLGPSEDGSDGLIACGSYTGNGSNTGPVINLGWEPQWLLVKDASSGGTNWTLVDSMRGFTATGVTDAFLKPNTSDAEDVGSYFAPTATGFILTDNSSFINSNGNTYIYIAIRRGPMREPTSGTEVLGLNARTGTGANATVTGGLTADAVLVKNRGSAVADLFSSRLTGTEYLVTSTTAAKVAAGDTILQANPWDVMDGVKVGTTSTITNASSNTFINYLFKRAPGFFDVTTWVVDGTGNQTINHNLGVVPEMVISKNRNDGTSGSGSWWIAHKDLPGWDSPNENDRHTLQFTASASAQEGYHRDFTDSSIRLLSNASGGFVTGNNCIAYLFASLDGVSKVGSYTGNGSSQTINCAFTTGARFVLIKRTNSTGDWYVWDTARGIVTGNDPHLSLNTTAAEVTSNDTIDPDSTGFIVNQVAATNVNVNAATYIFLAIA